jgi:hypothetical protein
MPAVTAGFESGGGREVLIDLARAAAGASGSYANFALTRVDDHVVRLSVMTEPFYWRAARRSRSSGDVRVAQPSTRLAAPYRGVARPAQVAVRTKLGSPGHPAGEPVGSGTASGIDLDSATAVSPLRRRWTTTRPPAVSQPTGTSTQKLMIR